MTGVVYIIGMFFACILIVLGFLIFVGWWEDRKFWLRQPEPRDLQSERLEALASRYANDEISFAELEQQAEDVLNGKWTPVPAASTFSVNPYRVVSNAPGAYIAASHYPPQQMAMLGSANVHYDVACGTVASYAYPLTPSGVRAVPDRNDLLIDPPPPPPPPDAETTEPLQGIPT
jgi:hypothetical protein